MVTSGPRALLALAFCLLSSAASAQQRNIGGAWGTLGNWPLIAIHAVLTPGGNVLTYGTDAGGRQTGKFIYDVWRPSVGSVNAGHTTLPNGTGTDIFCSAQIVLPRGDVLIGGGDNFVNGATTNTANSDANIFGASSNTLSRAGSMNRPRWYATMTTLENGDTYIQGGTGGRDRPEVRRSTTGTFHLLPLNTSSLEPIYPRNFLVPTGQVFGFDTAGNMYYVARRLDVLARVGSLGLSGATGAMYAPGKILAFGGGSSQARVITVQGGNTLTVTPTASLASVRDMVNATLLADGRVLATGGSAQWNQLVGVNNSAAIWNPFTGTWTIGPSGAVARLYHSTAILLPDASVLIAGGGAPGPLINTNAEIYYPPYLYDALGRFAARPVIASAAASTTVNATFNVTVGAGTVIHRVTMVKTGSVTHTFNMDQRFNDLRFTQSGNSLTVQTPPGSTLMTPGYYLLFAFNRAGVPSIARVVRVRQS